MAVRSKTTQHTECRQCCAFCDKTIEPRGCIEMNCPFLYTYEDGASGRSYMGCLQKVFAVEIDEFDRDVGLGRLTALHMNDSKTRLGSNVDRHANLGEGELGEEGLRVFLSEKRFKGLPVLLEVPGPDGHGPDKRQVDIAKRLRDEVGAAAKPRKRRP